MTNIHNPARAGYLRPRAWAFLGRFLPSPICLAVVLFTLAATTAWGQSGQGSIQGTVKDASGAVVPAATVRLVHSATNREYTTKSNEVGFYLFPGLQIGEYTLAVESTGMSAWNGHLTLLAGQTASIDPALAPASTGTTVTVAGDVTDVVTSTSPTVAKVLERARVEQLPLNSRQVMSLIYMTTPGTESGAVPRLYGLKYAGEYVQDGAVLQNREWGGSVTRMPGLDTISELRAEVSNSSARMSRPGTYSLTTRSGTNMIHGSLFETARNSAIGVTRQRQDTFSTPPHLARNEFGASLGAPIYIPKVYNGKNRTFFFFAYEGFQLRQQSTRSIAVPTAAMRQGNFGGLVDGSGFTYPVYDPWSTQSASGNWSRTPFPNGQIPTGKLSPLAQHLYSITPLPTRSDNPLVTSNWYGTGFNRTKQHTETTRVDHKFTDRDQAYFRYTHSVSTAATTSNPYNSSPTTLDGKANAYMTQGQNDTGAANWSHTFSPTFFSETLVSVSHDYQGQLPYTGSEDLVTELGLSNPFKGIGFPRIQYSLTASGGMSYDSSINPNFDYSRIYVVDQNFTKIFGRHELQFGGRFRYESTDTMEDQQETQGGVNFNTSATGLFDPTSGSSYAATTHTGFIGANTYLGLGSYWARFNPSYIRLRNHELAGYFQDNFKVNSKLTLNLGVRYEYNSPVNEKNRAMIGFDQQNDAIVLGRPLNELAALGTVLPSIASAYQQLGAKYETAQQAGLPSNLVHPNRFDFGPRLGFAYRMGGSNHPAVLRGGYSIFAYTESMRLFQGLTAASVPSIGTIQNNPNLAEQSPDGLPNYMLRSAPTLIAGQNTASSLDVNKVTGITRGSGSVFYLDPNQPTARAHEWNLMLEREVFANTVAKAGWIGTHGARMAQWAAYNDASPDYVWFATTGLPIPTGEYASVARRPYDKTVYGAIDRYQKSGWSNDNSIQLEFEHRYSKGYAFQAFYVMSNAMRVAGDGWRDDFLEPASYFMPGSVPTDENARNRLMFYRRDNTIPKHRFNWNFLVDLPAGRGKPIAGHSSRLVNTIIGGWQLAGSGQLYSRYFALPTSYWTGFSPVKTYGKSHPVQDCRSGTCYNSYLYWNGYIPANRVNSTGTNGKPNGVMGMPSDYKAFASPLIPMPADGGTNPNDPYYGKGVYDTNTVWVPLKDGTSQKTTFNNGLNPMQNQYVLGPMLWNMSASLFKTIPITERVMLRMNADLLDNLFNMPGTNLPASDGIISTKTSANAARTLQLTLRLTW
jgi:hypothetical protein